MKASHPVSFRDFLAGRGCACPECSFGREPRSAKAQHAAAMWLALFWWAA